MIGMEANQIIVLLPRAMTQNTEHTKKSEIIGWLATVIEGIS
jgi:hypothetical protein